MMQTATLTTDGSFYFDITGGIFNQNNTMLYIANYGSSLVSICPVDANGAIGTCTTSNGNGTFNGPNDVVLSNNYAYIPNNNIGTVSICPIKPDGSFGTCTSTSGNGTITAPLGIDVSTDQKYVYITNAGNSTISSCPINSDGSLGVCGVNAGNGTFSFSNYGTNDLFLTTAGYAYIVNDNNNTLSICPVNTDGSLGNCIVNQDSTYNFSESITISYGKTISLPNSN
jgi:6-phosphogluconolactonase (cycloisomerase 2 family)